MSPLLHVHEVWKAYPRHRGGTRTLRGLVTRRVPLLAGRGETRWALQGVSLEAAAGEAVGVIGQNGAGKSTLLRLAAGVGRPSRGSVRAPEATAAVLSLGDTFAGELTGRENALTAAVVAGLGGAHARRCVDAAIEFAELEEYAAAPVRTYSDGMRLRLAFGVVAQLEPEVLLLDEVMAVGDLRFQAKCMERIRALRDGGAAVVLASHDLDQVERECARAVWLQGGAVRQAGAAREVVAAYRDAMRSQTMERTPAAAAAENRFGSQEVVVERVEMPGSIATGDPLSITVTIRAASPGEYRPIVGVTIHRAGDGVIAYDVSTEGDGFDVGAVGAEPRAVELRFERLDLLPGEYVIDVGAYEPGWEFAYDFHWNAYPLQVTGRSGDKGVFRPPHSWR